MIRGIPIGIDVYIYCNIIAVTTTKETHFTPGYPILGKRHIELFFAKHIIGSIKGIDLQVDCTLNVMQNRIEIKLFWPVMKSNVISCLLLTLPSPVVALKAPLPPV